MSEMKKCMKEILFTRAAALRENKYLFILFCGLFAALQYVFLTFLKGRMSQGMWDLFVTLLLAVLLLLIFGTWGYQKKRENNE